VTFQLERLSSADGHLDAVFGGGLPLNSINVVMGAPGTGKTILAQQYVYFNATVDRPAIYLSTVSEPFEKIIRYVQNLDFFDRDAIGKSVFYEDLSIPLLEGELPRALERIVALLTERRPALLVIDSFRALAAFADTPQAFHRFVHTLAGHLGAMPLSSFWIGEYGVEELEAAPEFAVADAVVSLRSSSRADSEMRLLQPLKVRGSGFASGSHAYRISSAGIAVFPRLADLSDDEDYRLSPTRVGSGITSLDEMLEGGYYPGAATLVAGPAGIGKTLMGLHFIVHGAGQGDPGVIASMAENPTQLERMANGFGWSTRSQGIDVLYRSPVHLSADEWAYELLERADTTGAKRILIDGLNDLQFAVGDPIRFREYVYSLTQRCSRAGISLMMTMELSDLFRAQRLSDSGVSQLSANVILLQYVRNSTGLARCVTVLKTRSSGHDANEHEFVITNQGLVVQSDAVDPA
jgi:circadian clock protein KaiC